MQAFDNVYHHRRVADKDAKPCTVCYKPTTVVLTTPKDEDFFFVCPSHLSDRSFAEPHEDELRAIAERKKERELTEAKERIIREFEDKAKTKSAKAAEKSSTDDGNSKAEVLSQSSPSVNKSSQDDPANVTSKVDSTEPRIFKLNTQIFRIRINRLRSRVLAQRATEVQRKIQEFPSVPPNLP